MSKIAKKKLYIRVARKGFSYINDDYYYHQKHKRLAYSMLKELVKNPNSHQRLLFKKCDEYAREVLGAEKYSPWLKVYSVFNDKFIDGWIPDDYYGKLVVPRQKGLYGKISHSKALTNKLFETDLSPDLVFCVNGLFFTSTMQPLKQCEVKSYLFSLCEKVVYKMDYGQRGEQVLIYTKDNFPDNLMTIGNGVFQKYILQHSFFNDFSDNAVSTIRITTVVDNESNIQCRASFLRLPRLGETHVKAHTNILVPINIESGELEKNGYYMNLNPIECHPDTNKMFINQKIPNWNDCINTCITLHQKMPFARVIGWDVVIDSTENVVLIEWNGDHGDIKYHEILGGPCFTGLGWEDLWKQPFNQVEDY